MDLCLTARFMDATEADKAGLVARIYPADQLLAETLKAAGLTQAEIGPRGLRREWTLVDDTAVWTQILLATGAA